MQKLPFTHLFAGRSHEPAIELAEKLSRRSRRSRCRRCSSPTRARRRTTPRSSSPGTTTTRSAGRRRRRSSRASKAYHGVTIASASLTGLPLQPRRLRPADRRHPAHRLPALLPLRASRARPRRISRRRLAAELEAMIEQRGAGHDRRLHRRAGDGRGRRRSCRRRPISRRSRRCCDKHDIALHRRRGDLRLRPHRQHGGARETFGIQPDTISIAKALTSAYLPLGARDDDRARLPGAARRRAARSASSATASPIRGHPVACAVALKTLEIYERDRIVGHVAARWRRSSSARLDALADHPLVGEARGIGLIGGARARRGQALASELRRQAGVGAQVRRLRAGRGPDRARARRRHASRSARR